MATLAELRSTILGKLDDGSVQRPDASQVTAQINSTIDYYENDAFWFTQEIVDLTATEGSRILTGVPADFKMVIEPNGLVLVQSNIKYPMKHVTPLAYDSLDVDGSGRPRWYTYRDGNFELYSIPDQNYTITLFYQKLYVDLVADEDENDFTNFTDRLIEYRTLADLLLDYREDTERGGIYLERAKEELKQILTETYNRTSTGNLSTENIVDSGRRIGFGVYY